MTELLIWLGCGIFWIGAFVGGWYARAWYFRSPEMQAFGVHVCARCGEPMPKGACRQADGRWLHPHCKGA